MISSSSGARSCGVPAGRGESSGATVGDAPSTDGSPKPPMAVAPPAPVSVVPPTVGAPVLGLGPRGLPRGLSTRVTRLTSEVRERERCESADEVVESDCRSELAWLPGRRSEVMERIISPDPCAGAL